MVNEDKLFEKFGASTSPVLDSVDVVSSQLSIMAATSNVSEHAISSKTSMLAVETEDSEGAALDSDERVMNDEEGVSKDKEGTNHNQEGAGW